MRRNALLVKLRANQACTRVVFAENEDISFLSTSQDSKLSVPLLPDENRPLMILRVE